MSLWQWKDLTAACGLPVAEDGPDVGGISIDTRSLEAGDLFVALSGDPGPRFHTSTDNPRDGHEFVPAAESRGAAAVMVDRAVETRLPCLRVANTLDGLWDLGRYARRRMGGKVAAITGSSGKTTARHWLQAALAGQGRVHGSRGSFNNHWGVPLSLARMPGDTEFGIFEIGMNHPGEIAPLAELVAPDVALIVNVLPAHLGYFQSLDEIRREKLSIASGLAAGGVLVVPDDLDCRGVSVPRRVTFGFGEQATVRGTVRYEGEQSRIVADVNGESIAFDLASGGEHRALTCLGVLATAWALGVDVHEVARQFGDITTPAGRGNVVRAGRIEIIDDSYNANPVSMRYALEALARRKGGRRIALLGEMRELGEDSERMHLELAPLCEDIDGVITVGSGFSRLAALVGERHWGHYDAVDDIDLTGFAAGLEPGDVILVKGANKVFWVNDFVQKLARAVESDSSG